MTDLSSFVYSPVIRTRRAELLGLSELDDPYSAGLIPLFELTRSRRTKANPEGAVEASVEALIKVVGEAPFVVDVTTQKSLTNSKVEYLLDASENFRNWTEFVVNSLPATAIPVVHLTAPFEAGSVVSQVEAFQKAKPGVALRIPSEFEEIDELATTITRALGSFSNVAVYADVGMVSQKGYPGALARLREIASVFSELKPGMFATVASSFPSTVTPFGDVNGLIPLFEVRLSDTILSEFDEMHGIHGDYACIHPLDMEGTAMNWVPRVDVPLDDSLYYYSFRRHEGGYVRAASAALTDRRYVELKCWAEGNIKLAAAGSPAGKSPAFWISARLNMHIARQLKRLGA